MSVEELNLNCATMFLLPGIGFTRKDILKYGFVSAFIDDINHDFHHKYAVYLLFRPTEKEKNNFQLFLKKELRNPLFMYDYDYVGGYIIAVYRFSEEYDNEYDLFLEGKYSEFSKKYIDLFPKGYLIVGSDGTSKMELSLQHRIFNKTSSVREYWEEKVGEPLPEDAEMWSKPNIEHETLDIKNI